MKIIFKKNGKTLCQNLEIADSFSKRTIGLLGRNDFGNTDGMLILPCRQIHSFFMEFEFDAVYLNKKFKVQKIFQNVKMNRILPYGFGVFCVLELPQNTLGRINIEVGDEFEIAE